MCARLLQRRFYFFNCFLFKKLVTEEEGSRRRSRAQLADDAHTRVAKWTARVDIFERDFVIIPINQSLHWTLAIVCHAGEAARRAEAAARRAAAAEADVIEARGDAAAVASCHVPQRLTLVAAHAQIDDDAPPDVSHPSPVILHLNSMTGALRGVRLRCARMR